MTWVCFECGSKKKINKFQVNTEFFTSILNPKHIDCNIRKMCKYLFILQSCVVCTYFLPHYFSSDSNYKPILYLSSADWHQEAHKRNHICEDTYVVVLLQKYRVYYIFGIVLNTHTCLIYHENEAWLCGAITSQRQYNILNLF